MLYYSLLFVSGRVSGMSRRRDLVFNSFHFNADSFSSGALAARSPQYHYLGEAAVPHFTSVYTPYAANGRSIYRLVGLWVI